MKKYMLSFFGGNKALRHDNLKKADQETKDKHNAAWGEWMAELVKANQLETGYPLMSDGKKISSVGVQDYHFPDTTEGGFVVLKAESLDQVAEIAGKSPVIKNGGWVLARPCGS